jgi:hypothetical protein
MNKETKASVWKATGMTCEEIKEMDIEEVQARIEKKIGKKLTYSFSPEEHAGVRGQVYQSANRLFSFDTHKADAFIDALR